MSINNGFFQNLNFSANTSSSQQKPSYADIRAQQKLDQAKSNAISQAINAFGAAAITPELIAQAEDAAKNDATPRSQARAGVSYTTQIQDLQTQLDQAITSNNPLSFLTGSFDIAETQGAKTSTAKRTRTNALNLIRPLEQSHVSSSNQPGARAKQQDVSDGEDGDYYSALGYGAE